MRKVLRPDTLLLLCVIKERAAQSYVVHLCEKRHQSFAVSKHKTCLQVLGRSDLSVLRQIVTDWMTLGACGLIVLTLCGRNAKCSQHKQTVCIELLIVIYGRNKVIYIIKAYKYLTQGKWIISCGHKNIWTLKPHLIKM